MSIRFLGDFAEDATVYIPFNTFDSDGASVTITDFANTDVHVHKDGDDTQRNNAAGVTVYIDFDSITGNHLVKIDTSENTVADFWVTGSDYDVRIEGVTINTQTVNAWICKFSIENRFDEVDVVKISGDSTAADNLEDVFDGTYAAANMKIFWENGAGATTKTVDDVGSTAIRSGTAQAGAAGTITLDASASATNNLYNGQICLLTGGTGAGQCRAIVDYIGSTKVASVTPNWTTNPGATSTFELQPASSILTHLLSMAVGKFSKSGNVYTFLDWDDATTLSTLTWSATGRTRS